MNTHSKLKASKGTALLAVLALPAAAFISGCGVAKSGFNSDPLAKNGEYKRMAERGVPQRGTPNQVEKLVYNSDGTPADETTTALAKTIPTNSTKAGDAEVPTAEDVKVEAPVATDEAAAPTSTINAATMVEITIPAAPLPETQILNFVEGRASHFRLNIQDANGKATVSGLPKGATFSNVAGSPDLYDIKWVPQKGAAGSKGYTLSGLKVSVGANRKHRLIVNVMNTAEVPAITKIEWASNSITPGESVLVKVTVANVVTNDPLEIRVARDAKASKAIDDLAKSAVPQSSKKLGNNTQLVELLLDSKGIKFTDADLRVRLTFQASAGQGSESVSIPQIIQLNQKAKSTAKKAGGRK